MSRRKARLAAIQYIYSKEFNSEDAPDEFIDYINSPKSPKDREFSYTLINGVLDNIKRIDKLISKYAQQGSDMILLIDKCILRVGIYELLYLKETPYAVVINEYVEIAKSFSNDTSKAFINAVLDKVRLNEYER